MTETPANLPRSTGALAALLAVLTVACASAPAVLPGPLDPRPALTTFHLPVMGTVITVALPDDDAATARARDVFAAFAAVDEAMSEWKPGSPLARVNAAAGGPPVAVPPALLELVVRALALTRDTDRAFDPTWAALWDLWDFRAIPPRLPAPADIAARLPLVDATAVTVDRAAGTLALHHPGMKLGLGAIAKGYALDRAAERLLAAGTDRFVLSAGGQVSVYDAAGSPVLVAIRAPRAPGGAPLATVALTAATAPRTVSTSGDYERFFVVDGIRYHHVLDPRTGRPSTAAQAATVVGPDGALADGLSTALMILGPRWLPTFMTRFPAYDALVVAADGSIHATPGLCAAVAGDTPAWCAPAAAPRPPI